MAVQQGFEYEKNAIALLNLKGFSDGIFAGASHARPDITLVVRKQLAGCELKMSPTAGGSLVIKAYANKLPHWQFGNINDGETEKLFLADLVTRSGAAAEINEKWSAPVYNVADRSPEWEKEMLKTPLRKRYDTDLKTCPDVKLKLDAKSMSDYYNLKKTHYINIGTHGFYLLGDRDPLKLNERMKKLGQLLIPRFEDKATLTARIRCQSKGVTKAAAAEKSKGTIGAQGYQFTFTLEFGMTSANSSHYNIAPIDGKSVDIIKSKLNTKCFN